MLADASLTNDQLLENYMRNDVEAPEKILVSDSAGPRPFRMSAGSLRFGGHAMSVLHVMADASYQALLACVSKLTASIRRSAGCRSFQSLSTPRLARASTTGVVWPAIDTPPHNATCSTASSAASRPESVIPSRVHTTSMPLRT